MLPETCRSCDCRVEDRDGELDVGFTTRFRKGIGRKSATKSETVQKFENGNFILMRLLYNDLSA